MMSNNDNHEHFSIERHALIRRILLANVIMNVAVMFIISYHGAHPLAYWTLVVDSLLSIAVWVLIRRTRSDTMSSEAKVD